MNALSYWMSTKIGKCYIRYSNDYPHTMLKENNKIKTTGFHNTGDVGLPHTVITIKEI